MSDPNPALFTFFKLTVSDIGHATRFFEEGFGMAHADTIETSDFCEHIMTGKNGSATIVLFQYKDGRAIEIGNGYGPLGMMTRDLDADLARALAAGGTQKGKTVSFGPVRVAMVVTPDGHTIELMQRGERTAAQA